MPQYKIEDEHLNSPKRQKKEVVAFCPFHDDRKTPNLHIFDDRTKFKCFACGRGGNAYDFLKELGLLPAQKKAKKTERVNYPNKSDVETAHKELMNNETALKYIHKQRLWNKETIKSFKLGLKNDFLTIPIWNTKSILVNIRLYNIKKKEKQPKFMGWSTGLGARLDLFPAKALLQDEILLVEGEPDCILARQFDLNAVAFTGGVGAIKEKHLNAFLEKKVIICFDIDPAGQKAAARITRYLARICPEVKNIKLPISEPSNGDFTDYVLAIKKAKKNVRSSFNRLVESTSPYVISAADRMKIQKMEPQLMQLEEAAMASNSQVKQQFKAVIAGKDTEPYLVPKVLNVFCGSATGSKHCIICPLYNEEKVEIHLTAYQPEILQVVGCSQDQARGIIRKMADIPKQCHTWQTSTEESQNVEDLILIPEVFSDAAVGRQYVSRRAFVVDDMVETNRPFLFTGWTIPHPSTHHAVHLIETAKPTQTAIDSFKMTDEIKKKLSIFQPRQDQSIEEKLNEIHQDFEDNVTHIINRKDLLQAIDLVFHSVLKFNFQGIPIRRGWIEVLVIGDTRQGKSESGHQLIQHYKAGELISSENMSFAGLVGGINIHGNRKMIQWGKLPLNDGRLVVLDEFSGLGHEEIEKLSGIRASGIAEITKIQTEKTLARVRLLILSNPRKRTLADFSTGIQAIQDLIGKSEDIARFDFAVSLASNEVKPEDINKKKKSRVEHVFTSELCAEKIRWIWSRKSEDIVFEKRTEDLILWMATRLAKQFHSSIPLVEPSEQRVKLARITAAIAGMVFSCDDTGEKIIIKPEHAEAAFNILVKAFKKPSMAYDHYSEAKFLEQTLLNESEVRGKVANLGIQSIIGILHKNTIQLGDFEDWCGADRQKAKELAAFLMKTRCLKKPYTVYVKTPPFIKLLIQIKAELKGEDNETSEDL